jgi:hypothetical protein
MTLAISIRKDLIIEIILRSGGRVDPAKLVEDVLESFLDRTRGDAEVWSQGHAEEVAREEGDTSLAKFGVPTKGYYWAGVFCPNGTQFKMSYKAKDYFAEVRHQQLFYNDNPCSPSQFARLVANNTSRNAWNDVWIKRPTDAGWVFANSLRISPADRFGNVE